MLNSVEIRQLTTIDELNEATLLEKQIWHTDSAQLHHLVAANDHGALLLGAFLHDELIGINYSYPAFVNNETYLYSHLLGVKSEYRDSGVGELLKLKLKEIGQQRGFTKCQWLCDPLESSIAFLNFTKLRTYTQGYYENYYGHLNDYFNNTLPSDRFKIDWDLVDNDYLRWDAKVEECLEEAVELVPWSLNLDGWPMLDEENVFDSGQSYTEEAYFLYIPKHFQKIKLECPTLAEEWRYKTRKMMMTLMQQSYTIVYLQKVNEHVNRYLFVKRGQFAI